MEQQSLSRRRLLQILGASSLMGIVRPSWAAPVSLADIKKRGVLRVGCEAVLPPFTFREEGKIVGYDVDVATMICEPLGVKPQMIDTAWAGVIPALYADRFDVIMSQMTYTKERLQKVAFSIPYVEASLAMLIRAEDAAKIKSTDDLRGRNLGVQLGSPGQTLQNQLNDQWKAAGKESFKSVRIYDDYPSSYLALSQGSIDAVFNTLSALSIAVKQSHGKFAIVRGVGGDRWAGIATRLENTELVGHLDAQLRAMRKDDRIYKLQEKWFGFRMVLADSIPNL